MCRTHLDNFLVDFCPYMTDLDHYVIWIGLFGPVYLDQCIWTRLLGPVYLNLESKKPLMK